MVIQIEPKRSTPRDAPARKTSTARKSSPVAAPTETSSQAAKGNKESITIRLSPDVLAALREHGSAKHPKGWQPWLNDLLREVLVARGML